jgi:DNA-binding NarL/FixJ family response regulator
MTTLEDWMETAATVRTRVDDGVGWITPHYSQLVDVRVVQRHTLDAVAEHARNPEVHTIVVADFGTQMRDTNACVPSGSDTMLAELCWQVTELVWQSSKTVVFRCHVDSDCTGLGFDVPVYMEPLTEREHQVLSMAGQGVSARTIAARLFISERTVESHVSNGYRKLGINSRIELVRRASEFGL